MERASAAVKSAQKRSLVLGSTGGVGRHVVRVLVEDPRVDKVTAVVRGKKEISFWVGDKSSDASRAAASMKLQQVEISDFEKLNEHEKEFQGHDAFLSCLGSYSSQVKDEAFFENVEVGYNEAAAQLALKGGAISGGYLSQWGALKPSEASSFTIMANRVKGKGEAIIERLFPQSGLSARAGAIFDRVPETERQWFDKLADSFLMSWMRNGANGITANEIAKAMVQSCVFRPLSPNRPVENAELKVMAQHYDVDLAHVRKA